MLASCRKFYPILLATLRYILTMIFFIFLVSAFGSELIFSCSGNYFWFLETVVLSPFCDFYDPDVLYAHALLRVLEQ